MGIDLDQVVKPFSTSGAKAIANIIKTTFGPRSMLKMIIDNQGNIIITNDGYSILREISTDHPIARSLIELSRMQEDEAGDGTTTIVLLSAELIKISEMLLKKNFHPNQIIGGYFKILNVINSYCKKNLRFNFREFNFTDVLKIISTSICTKFTNKYSKLICEIAFKAVYRTNLKLENSQINEFVKIEKITNGKVENSRVLSGILIEKDISHPKMRRFITNPKILLIDCSFDFKKTEFKSLLEIKEESHWKDLLKIEENHTIYVFNIIKKFQPDVVVTEKNLSDLALYYFFKSNISVIRRIKKSDMNRLSKATGSTIVSNLEEIERKDIGYADCFSVKKIGENYYTFITGCKNHHACTIVLFGLSKDILDEIERNLKDAIGIARIIFFNLGISLGGGATELALIDHLYKKSISLKNDSFFVYNSIGLSLEIIPKVLIENCGMPFLSKISELKRIHSSGGLFYGIEGKYGKICDTRKLGIVEPFSMKIRLFRTAIENATMIMRVDKIFYGLNRKK